jgi:hypothetical protein
VALDASNHAIGRPAPYGRAGCQQDVIVSEFDQLLTPGRPSGAPPKQVSRSSKRKDESPASRLV